MGVPHSPPGLAYRFPHPAPDFALWSLDTISLPPSLAQPVPLGVADAP